MLNFLKKHIFSHFNSSFKPQEPDIAPIAWNLATQYIVDPLIIIDTQNRVVGLNPSAQLFFDFDESVVIGQDIIELAYGWLDYETINSIDIQKRVRLIKEDFCYDFDMRICPVFDNDGKFIGKLLFFRDITELEDARKEIEISKKRVEMASINKSKFLSNMSHEIRTPMNAIIGMSDLLMNSPMIESQKEYVRIIKNSSKYLLSLINDILDLSKVEARKLNLEKIPFDILMLIENKKKEFSLLLSEKGVKFEFDWDGNIPLNILGDPLRLEQIIINLVNNAIKFTEEGSISICIKEIETVEDIVTLRITVSDTGVGIPEDKVDKLFEEFMQVDNSIARRYGGTGLGLSIVKHLVTLMNGTIKVESNLNSGTTFIIDIPFEIPQE